MKTALIRVLAIATLASSMSAFAAIDGPKDGAAKTSSNKQQAGCASGEDKKQKKAKPQPDEQINNEKEFDRILLGIYG